MLLQGVINGIAVGSLIAVLGVGYGMITRSGLTYHFVHAAAFTFGAYFFQLGTTCFPHAIFLCIMLGCVAAVLVGVGTETIIYRKLRARKAPRHIFILCSFGFYIILQNIISLWLGDASRPVELWRTREGWPIFGGRITGLQVITIACAASLLAFGNWWVHNTEMGKSARAIGAAPDLAEVVGINMPLTLSCVMGIGSLGAGLAGVLSACDTGVFPTMGLLPFFAALVGVIAGGGSLTGTALTCVAIGILQQLVIIWTDAAWQDAIVFIVLIALLIARPKGLFAQLNRSGIA